MNITVKTRHMESSDAIKDYVEAKAAKLPRYFDRIQSIEVVLDIEADQPTAEVIVQAGQKHTFVASHRDKDMYATIDQCMDKISQQLRRYKDKLRDHKGPSHEEISELGEL
jgi:putative sigma-54 modulation protein